MSRDNPFRGIEELFERMNEELNDVGRQLEGELRSDLNVDVLEDDTEIRVVADLPGFDASDVEVTVAGRELTIEATRDLETEYDDSDSSVRYHRRERHRESITRRVKLPADVEEGEATAGYDQGVLTVRLPKITPDETDSTKIEVE